MTNARYDVVIIGSGAGGGTLAHRLASTGKRILLLERGGWLPREKENWSSRAVFTEGRYKSGETWHDGDGKPFQPGIHYWVGGNTKLYGAVLLRAASDAHPDGLDNRSGVVGRHYMCHNNAAFVALSKRANPTRFQKTLGVNDFYHGNGDSDGDLPLGHIQMLGKSDAEMFREDAPRLMPGMALDAMARHSVDFWLTGEDLPLAENRVTLDRNGDIRLAYTENNLEGFRLAPRASPFRATDATLPEARRRCNRGGTLGAK